jgi:hypothetical protein
MPTEKVSNIETVSRINVGTMPICGLIERKITGRVHINVSEASRKTQDRSRLLG